MLKSLVKSSDQFVSLIILSQTQVIKPHAKLLFHKSKSREEKMTFTYLWFLLLMQFVLKDSMLLLYQQQFRQRILKKKFNQVLISLVLFSSNLHQYLIYMSHFMMVPQTSFLLPRVMTQLLILSQQVMML